MRKIICIANDFWRDSDEKWGLNRLVSSGYEVELWRVGYITNGSTVFEKLLFSFKLEEMTSWKKFYHAIFRQKKSETFFVFWSQEQSLDYSKMLICLLRGKYGTVDLSTANATRFYMLCEKRLYSTTHHWMDRFLPSISFFGSRHHTANVRSMYQMERGNNVFLHTFDYDMWLKGRNNKVVCDEEYILFLDQNFLDHKDQVNSDIRWISNAEVFVKEVNAFLDEVERQFHTRVIVSAHPTAEKRVNRVYGTRKVVFGDTCGWSKSAKFVISNSSGAMGYAVLNKVPLLLFTNYQLRQSSLYMNNQMPKARMLKARILNISQSMEGICLKDYLTDVSDYECYVEYMTADPEDKVLLEDSIVKYMEQINEK